MTGNLTYEHSRWFVTGLGVGVHVEYVYQVVGLVRAYRVA